MRISKLRLLQAVLLLAAALVPARTLAQQPATPHPVRPELEVGYAPASPRFRVIAIGELGSQHGEFVAAAKLWLNKLAADNNFAIDYITNARLIDDAFLAKYKLFIQLNYPPFSWTPTAAAAFQKAIDTGSIGWIGFHHATLLGEYENQPMWLWFYHFMGDIRFKSYISTFANGTVHVEDSASPLMKDVPSNFIVNHDEWYTYDRSPSPNVHVLASVDESSYVPTSDIKMGDHPIIWTNEHIKARNVYFQIGHSADAINNPAIQTIFKNSIFWAANQ